ncbi:MAG: metal ABC transporter permease [Bacteroidetes bacterium]|nr:metal ABC transporter permease [Bacteroidota bacterium]
METFIGEIWSFGFFRMSMITAVLTAISCGIMGTYIVTRRIVFISGGLTHASFGGIGLGYFLGINPILGAAGFAVLSALGIEYASRRISIREDSAIAILWSFGMAIGIIFIFITPGYAPNLMTYLFGSILTVSNTDLWMLTLLVVLILSYFFLFYRYILYVAFDESYAITRRIPVTFIKYSMMVMLALTIVFNIRVVGIILVLSLLTIPQSIATLFTGNFYRMMILSILFGLIGTVSGLIASYFLDIPSGAAIIFFLVLMFLVIKVIMKLK